jgi:hypothetical protein
VQKPASAIQLSKTGFDCHKYWAKMHLSVVEIPLEVPTDAQNQGGWTKICSSSGSRHSSKMFSLPFTNNHSSHASVWSYNFSKDNGIIVAFIPHHTSHRCNHQMFLLWTP